MIQSGQALWIGEEKGNNARFWHGDSGSREPLKLKFVGVLIEQLVAKLCPGTTATVVELISNEKDINAQNVCVTVPLSESWKPDKEIIVLDHGHEMTRDQLQKKYLVVERKRRQENAGKTERGRLVHGRKGIGKLAAFWSVTILDCYTVRYGKITSFRVDYNKIRWEYPGAHCLLEEHSEQKLLIDPNGRSLAKGTRINLSNLRLKRAVPKDQFVTSMPRRFPVNQTEMKIFIDGQSLQ